MDATLNKIYKYIFLVVSVLFTYFLFTTTASAQSPKAENKPVLYKLSGKIISSENNEPLEMANITISTSLWATSDTKGNFSIPQIKAGTYVYEVSYLGFEKQKGKITVQGNVDNFIIKLKPLGLGLKEVVVTAQEQKMGSASKIEQTAIQHIQPKSVVDLLQLLPGNVTQNPDINSVAQANIREISSDANNALGTAIIMDGAPVSNDANMQAFSTATSGANSSQKMNSMNDQTTSGRGTDLRSISPDNIESVEVIRGIPSAEYGNLTSGVVVIKTKSGATPLEVKAKVDPSSKMFYAGKGFNLKNKGGAINIAADYSQSYSDIRKKYTGYDRITGNLGYSNVFMSQSHPLSLNLKLSYFRNLYSEKQDPQLLSEERIKNNNEGWRFNAEGNWRLNQSWISNLSYSFMAQYSHQSDFSKMLSGSSVMPYSSSYVSGEFVVPFLPSGYYSEYTLDGKPIDIFGQLKANKIFQFSSETYTNIKLGIEWRTNGNKGNGLTYKDGLPPSTGSGQATRPRSFKSIPMMNNLSIFLEDKAVLRMKSTLLTLQAGVRTSTLFVDENQAKRGNITTIEPRINIDYQILNRRNNKIFNDLSIVGGFGISSKAPTMLYLYPNPTYFDDICFNSYSSDPAKQLAVMNTLAIENTANANLKPATSKKFEIGLAGKIKKISGNITFFYEKHSNEFSFNSVPLTSEYTKYKVPTGTTPSYRNGAVYYTDATGGTFPAGAELDTMIYTYGTPSNSGKTIKKGVEYSLNLGQIRALKTSIVVDGAWFYIKRTSEQAYYSYAGGTLNGKRYPFLALMPAGSGNISQRINTNFRFITHIPSLKMVFSTTAQVVWYQSDQRIYKDSNGNDVFYQRTVKNGNEDITKYFIDPIGFYDKKLDFISWQPEFRDNSDYERMMSIFANRYYYDKEVYPPTIMLNFRLTKEFGKFMELSFMANNFLKLTKTYKTEVFGGYKDLITPLYFGAEIKIKI